MVKATVTFHFAFPLSYLPPGVGVVVTILGDLVMEKVSWRDIKFKVSWDMLI